MSFGGEAAVIETQPLWARGSCRRRGERPRAAGETPRTAATVAPFLLLESHMRSAVTAISLGVCRLAATR